jgi:hypothetical protein
MLTQLLAITARTAVRSILAARRQLALALAIAATAAYATSSDAASTYDFLTVTGNGVAGPGAMSLFTSINNLGTISVTHAFSPGGFGTQYDNQNSLIFPSGFPVNFPGSGQVQGHLASTTYNHQSTVTFNLMNYNALDTVFGIWNTTSETANPPYRLEIIDSNSVLGAPTTFVPFGVNEDNTLQAGKFNLNMNLATGVISAGALINNGGTHTNAKFWKIPNGTKQIIVHGNLGPSLNGEPNDGVGYYFADLCPTEGNLADLIANDGMICNGDKKFSNFAYHPIGDMPDASLIDVVSTTDAQGNLGIRFIGPFADQPGGGASEALLEYKVTATDPNQRITDVHLAANANVVGQSGYATITETFLPDDPNVVLEAFDFQPGGRMLTDWADLTAPQMMLHVQKDITLNSASANSLATISFIDQTFSQSHVPEPTTVALGGLALIGLTAGRRRKAAQLVALD